MGPSSKLETLPKQKKQQPVAVPTNIEGMPEYDDLLTERFFEPSVPKFLPPDDTSLVSSSGASVTQMKVTLLNSVATSLLRSPDFRDGKDATRRHMKKLGEKVSAYDPEFILKLALYTRNELNIRTTANFMLALAANLSCCRPFLKKYYSNSIRLPSDWIEVAEIYQAFHDKSLNFGSLPTALRKVMAKKFTNFDAYQLAKYNKDTSKKKKNKDKKKDDKKKDGKKEEKPKPQPPEEQKPETKAETSESDSSSSDDEDDIKGDEETEDEQELERLMFTLKQLIRKLHVAEPVDHVMCLVGKRYPEDPEEFRRSGLPGTWDQDRAGKRMKLPTPETWETQVSSRGNKAPVWEELIDHHKLPFMAMLRNLRNVIIAGISPKHHQWIINKLTDEKAVINSRQFPFRFFSAYEVLNQLLTAGRVKSLGPVRKGKNPLKGPKAKKVKPMPEIDPNLIQKYKNALDVALKIATYHNVKPISGITLVLCNSGKTMYEKPCTSARGLGKPRTVLEIGILLGLMCKYACEDCTVKLYGNNGCIDAELTDGTILDNMAKVMDTVTGNSMNLADGGVPTTLLHSLLVDGKAIDNLVLLTNDFNTDGADGKELLDFLDKYRHVVNPNLLFVSIDLSGRNVGVSSTITPRHENDIHLAGYSDQILRFIAERGDSGQLNHVENIDKAYNLKAVATPVLLPTPSGGAVGKAAGTVPPTAAKQWRNIRVFISSTFRDMHGERDLLTRYVFPELRALYRAHCINIYEVDLRWGVTEEDTRSHKAIEICLSEISRCHYFISLLGQRYGFVPDTYEVPDSPEYDWVRDYPTGRSITELEIFHGALSDPEKVAEKAFFYFRNGAVLREVPREWRKDFESSSPDDEEKMESLKSRIRTSGLEVYDGYEGRWLGEIQEKPMVGSLEDFAKRVLYNLSNAIHRDFLQDETVLTPQEHAQKLQKAYLESQSSNFVGRKSLLSDAYEATQHKESGVIVTAGKPGSGKSAFMAALTQYLMRRGTFCVVSHFIGATPDSSNIHAILTRLCREIARECGKSRSIPDDYVDLVKEWPSFMQDAVETKPKLVILIDGLDLLEDKHNGRSLNWLPEALPERVFVVLSVNDRGTCHSILTKRDQTPTEIIVGALDMKDKAEIVRSSLAKHRKTLDESPFNNQMKLLLSKREASNPLYLRLACEELRIFGIYHEISNFLKKMPATLPALLQEVLNRLEIDHGQEFLSAALTLLCIVRNGLSEEELSNILPLVFTSSAVRAKVPGAVFAKLVRSISTFLQTAGQEDTEVLFLAHKEIEKVVRARYLRGAQADRERQLHHLIAQYFMSVADPNGDKTFKGNDMRSFLELPYHLVAAGDWKALEETLCNLNFVVHKCHFGLTSALLEDYTPSLVGLSAAKSKEVSRFTNQPKVQSFRQFVSRNLHVLNANPSLALQQAVNDTGRSFVSQMAEQVARDSPYPIIRWANKPVRSDPCKMILPHSNPVTAVTTSPDSALVAAGFENCIVKLYELSTGNEVHTYIGHAASITSVCFVGQNAVCSASKDSTLSLWNVGEGYRMAVMKQHKRAVSECTANKSGKMIVSVSWDTTIGVWKGEDGSNVTMLRTPGKSSALNCVSFHPEGQLVVVGCWDNTLKIWDTYNRRKLKVLKGHKSSIQACRYFESGSHIVSGSLDGEVRIWSSKQGVTVGVICGHALPLTSLSFTPNGQYLVTASNDQLIKVWAGTLGTPIYSLGVGGEHGYGHCLQFDRKTQTVAVGYHDGFVCKYNVQTGRELFTERIHHAAVRSMEVMGELYMTASADQTIKVWTPDSLPFHAILQGHDAPITYATWTKNGFASASEDMAILLWPHEKTKYTTKLSKKKSVHPVEIQPLARLTGHKAQVSCIAFGSDGVTMVSVSHDNSIIVWDTLSKVTKMVIPNAHKDWITSCTFTETTPPLLVTASNDFTLKLWNTSTWEAKTTLEGHTSPINTVSCSGGCIVSGATDGSVKVWSKKGIELTTLYCHQQRVNAVAIDSPAGAASKEPKAWADTGEGDEESLEKLLQKKVDEILIITTSDDGTVGVWKPFVPREITTLKGHSHRVLSVACTLNNQVVSSSLDGDIRVWEPDLPALLVERAKMEGHLGKITGTALTRLMTTDDGDNVLYGTTSGEDGSFNIWKIHVPQEDDTSIHVSMLYRVSVSSVPISSICMTSKSNGVITGSTNGNIKVWNFSETNYPSSSSSPISVGSLPITSLSITSDAKYLVATTWSNEVTAVSATTKRVFCSHKKHKNWVTDACVVNDGNTSIAYSIGTDQSLVEWPVKSPPQPPKGKAKSKSFAPPPPPEDGGVRYSIPLHIDGRRDDPWPLSVCSLHNKYIVISNSIGRIILFDRNSKRFLLTVQLHNDAIATMGVADKSLITGSADGTVKIWALRNWNGSLEWEQVGHYYCQSAVTSLSCKALSEGEVIILVGDCNGCVTVLKWDHGIDTI